MRLWKGSNWKDRETRRKYVDWLSQEMSIRSMEDWYLISNAQVIEKGGGELLSRFGNSLGIMLHDAYPDRSWQIWRFQHIPAYFWKEPLHWKDYLAWVSDQLNIKELKDWYGISRLQLMQLLNGEGFLQVFGRSLRNAITSVYSDHVWFEWLFHEDLPKGFWLQSSNQRRYLDWLAGELGIKTLEQWHSVKRSLVIEKGGFGILEVYKNSLTLAVRSVYGNRYSKPWNPKGFMDWLFVELGFKDLDDWYKITDEDLIKYGGGKLLNSNRYLVTIMQTLYPEHLWLAWRFKQKVPYGFWDSLKNQKLFVDWLSKDLQISDLDDWYRISVQQINRVAPITLILEKGLGPLLVSVYPNHPWDIQKISLAKPVKASQRFLFATVQSIFPSADTYEEYVPDNMEFKSGRKMQFDVYVSNHKLAFEYQGEQHYYEVFFLCSGLAYKERDLEKRAACESNNVTLIEVPFWWDFKRESLMATIHKYRPELIQNPGEGEPISTSSI